MGIRFRCHHCQHTLHVKDFQAGRRSRCPSCEMPFRIPSQDQEYSLTVEPVSTSVSSSPAAGIRVGSGEQATADQRQSDTAQAVDMEVNVSEDTRPESTASSQPIAPPVTARDRTSTTDSSKEGTRNQAKAAASSTRSATAKNNLAVENKVLPPPPNVAVTDSRLPEAIRIAPEAMWFVRPPSGGQFGPAAGPVFAQWVDERRVTRDSLVWREGWEQWKLADEVFLEAFPLLNKAGPPEPVFNPESKSNAGETATVGVKAPDWMVRRKQQKKKLQRQITLGLVVVAVLLTLVLIWVLFFRPKEKEKPTAANSLPYFRMVDSTPTTKWVFVVHSTVV